MIRLSAFADEISPDLDEQIAVLQETGIHNLDLRGVWDTNVLDLTDAQVDEIRRALAAHRIGVAAIGSPIGKVPIDGDFAAELARFGRALTLARAFGTPFVRIFSFYPPATPGAETPAATGAPVPHRETVLGRMRELTARAAAAGITLLHENEKGIYGDTVARCVDLLQTIDNPHLRAVLDPANFLQCGEQPYPAAYQALRPWLGYVHVKDATPAGELVVAGAGAADWPGLLRRLRDDDYDGVLALEPHLAAAGPYSGFSGPDRFRQAAGALQALLRGLGWDYA